MATGKIASDLSLALCALSPDRATWARDEPVDAQAQGLRQAQPASRATGNRCVRHLNARNMAHLLAAAVACGDKRGRWRSR